MTLAANDDLVAGPLTNYLTVITNDPINPSSTVKLTANIVGDNLKAVGCSRFYQRRFR